MDLKNFKGFGFKSLNKDLIQTLVLSVDNKGRLFLTFGRDGRTDRYSKLSIRLDCGARED